MKNVYNTCFTALLLLMGLIFFATGCDEKKEPEITYEINDKNFYIMISNAVGLSFTDIYNQNVAGKPTGNIEMTVDGPMGGKVTITGTTALADNGINMVDLVLNMNSVRYTYSLKDANNDQWLSEVTMTGIITYKGSWGTGFRSVNHQSDNMHIVGSVKYKDKTRTMNDSGKVSISSSTNVTAVDIFGHTSSW